MKNRLFYGDCLDVLKESIDDESIDLIYIDPPFNSKRNYNVLFESIDMTDARAQKEAFADTWSNVVYLDQLAEIQDLHLDLCKFLSTLDAINVSKGAVSYLTTMALRIFYMYRKLKKTGSFYLHCDQTMSHYLKVVCDLIFRTKNFRNEILWKRKTGRGEAQHKSNRYGICTDTILFYTKSKDNVFNTQFGISDPDYIDKHFRHIDEDGRRYRIDNLASPSPRPNLMYEYKGYKPPAKGWAISKRTMQRWDKEGKLHFPPNKEGRIQRKRYLDELRGQPVQNLWDDFSAIASHAKERMHYQTQKPEELLQRIITASSNEGDTVADFFCGCGTAVAVAERLNRRWIGVDISHLAVRLIYTRLLEPYRHNPERFRKVLGNIEINGFPRDVATARDLATGTKKGRIKFQDWVIEFMMDGVSNPKKVGDGGYDGYLTLYRDARKKDVVLIEVKSGSVNVGDLRNFIHVVEHEKAEIGVWVCFADQVTRGMETEARQAGYYDQEAFGVKFPRVQILTIEELLEGKTVTHPNPAMFNITFKRATGR
jgi:site-specific DNA-methyltransferase (adenine-specific)